MNLLTHAFSIEPKSPVNIWDGFLNSKDYSDVMEYYGGACGPKILDHEKTIPTKSLPPKQCWYNALTTSVHLWQMVHQSEIKDRTLSNEFGNSLVVLDRNCCRIIKDPLWETIAFLMKGVYYMEYGIPLNRLQEEETSHFLLHAVIGALPFCNENSCFRYSVDVFDRVLELHADQITESGPIRGYLPIHVAASNKGRLFQKTYYLNKRCRMFVKPQNIAGYMLNRIVETNPEAVSIRDSDGNLPMELSCMNGHAATGGLEKLLEVGTASIGSSCQHLLVSTCCPTNKAPPKKSRSWGLRKSKENENTLFYECKEGHKESLSTVYAIFRADPSVVLNYLLVNK